jgi:hypothetical protein
MILENVFDDETLLPLIDEINTIIDERANRLCSAGKIADIYAEEPFERRLAKLEEQCPEIGSEFDIMYLRGKEMFRFLQNRKLLDIAECLLGSELSCNPIQHLRMKHPPIDQGGKKELSVSVPWHQDAGVTSYDSETSEIVTFWIPLVDATAETGCMEIMPEVFKQGYLQHHKDGNTTIVPEFLPDTKPVVAECRKGGMIIMNKYTPHRGLPNISDKTRWSLDLRYHRTGAKSGRSFYPEFIVRSKTHPDRVLNDHREWCRMWEAALSDKSAGETQQHRV